MGARYSHTPSSGSLILDWIFTSFGAGVCALVAVGFGAQQADSLWPLPGLYLLEILLVGAAVVGCLALYQGPGFSYWDIVPWLAGGILLAFVILGGFSIGPYLFPAMLAFWLTGVVTDLHMPRKIAIHLGLAFLIALLQAGLMLLVVGIGY